jgi:hypothetical protein
VTSFIVYRVLKLDEVEVAVAPSVSRATLEAEEPDLLVNGRAQAMKPQHGNA